MTQLQNILKFVLNFLKIFFEKLILRIDIITGYLHKSVTFYFLLIFSGVILLILWVSGLTDTVLFVLVTEFFIFGIMLHVYISVNNIIKDYVFNPVLNKIFRFYIFLIFIFLVVI